MSSEPFDATIFIRAMLKRGWRWSEAEENLLVHPEDHDLCVRYNPQADRLSVSPKLDEHLKLIIPTPASKGRFWR